MITKWFSCLNRDVAGNTPGEMMRNQNKKVNVLRIVVIIIIAVSITVIALFHFILADSYKSIIEAAHNFPSSSTISSDGKYLLETIVLTEESGTYATFIIETGDGQSVIFECQEKYRTLDLKYIEWDSLNNVVVESADVGTITYKFENEKWVN